jgi:predicted ABC-type transport system involved in lysophospholipase L1 biosynthesis ATPase subunit
MGELYYLLCLETGFTGVTIGASCFPESLLQKEIMTSTKLDPMYDPVYNLERLADLGSIKEFEVELKNAQSLEYRFTSDQVKEVEAAKIRCYSNAIFSLEIPCDKAAQSGDLTALEENLKILVNCYQASNQTLDTVRVDTWRKSCAGIAISHAVSQAEEFALANVPDQRDALIVKAHNLSEKYKVPFTQEQQESEKRSLKITRQNAIEVIKNEVIAIVAATASGSGKSKLEQVARRLSAIEKTSQEGGLSVTPEEHTTFTNQWAPQLRSQILLEAMAFSETHGISQEFTESLDSLASLTLLSGVKVSESEIESIKDKAARTSLAQLVKQVENTLSIPEFDKLEADIKGFIANAQAHGCATPPTLSNEQVSILNNAFLSSRYSTIASHLEQAEKAIQHGDSSKAEHALAAADQVCNDQDVRFEAPSDYEAKKAHYTGRIGRIKIDHVFKEMSTIVPLGNYQKVGELSDSIRRLAESYGLTLTPNDQNTIRDQNHLARQNLVNIIASATIDKVDIGTLRRDLAMIMSVLESISEGESSPTLSPNTIIFKKLFESQNS